jgi:hypothetical protein
LLSPSLASHTSPGSVSLFHLPELMGGSPVTEVALNKWVDEWIGSRNHHVSKSSRRPGKTSVERVKKRHYDDGPLSYQCLDSSSDTTPAPRVYFFESISVCLWLLVQNRMYDVALLFAQ